MENKVVGRFCSKYTRFYDRIGNKGVVYREQTGVVLDIRADHTLTIQADGKSRNAEWEITEISFQNDPKRYYLRGKNSNTDVPNLPNGELIICGSNLMFSNIPADGVDFLYVRM